VSVIAISVSLALLGSVVAVALVARDVAFRAIDGQLAHAKERDARAVDAELAKMADRIAAAEATMRDLSLARVGGRR